MQNVQCAFNVRAAINCVKLYKSSLGTALETFFYQSFCDGDVVFHIFTMHLFVKLI